MMNKIQINETIVDAPIKPSRTLNTSSSNEKANPFMKILPLILGLTGISLLFGKGLFGIGGGKHGFMNKGFIGTIIGGGILATVLPSLWSSKSFGDRMSSAISKLATFDIPGFFKELAGCSDDAGAKNAINNAQNNINRFEQESAETVEKAKVYAENTAHFTKILNWVKKQGYTSNSETLVHLSLNTAIFRGKSLTNQETTEFGDKFIGILYINDEGKLDIIVSHATDLAHCIDSTYIDLLNTAMKDNNLNTGLSYIKNIKDPNIDDYTWFENCKNLISGLLTLTHNIGIETIFKLFENGTNNYCKSSKANLKIKTPRIIDEEIEQLKQHMHIILESNDDSIAELLNDPELASLKEDPLLNKFDENIKLYETDMKDEVTNLILSLYFNQDKDGNSIYKNVDTCVIYGIQGSQHYYYCRNKENAYLTTDVKQSVEFPGELIKKLEAESPIDISTGEHMSFDEGLKILWKEYKEQNNEEIKKAFGEYKKNIENNKSDINDQEIDENKEKQLFTEFIKQQGEQVLPYKKEKRDITGNSLKDVLQKFLTAVKLPQLMKTKKPGIKVMVYETNKKAVEKIRELCKKELNIEL